MDLKQVNDIFTQYLRPQTFPLGIRLCASESELPEKVRLPQRDLGVSISLCHAIALARRYGWVMAIDKTVSCYVPAISLGFVQPSADVLDGTFQEKLGLWGMNKERAAAAIKEMHKFEYGKYKYAVIAPLDRASFEPHVVMLYSSPAQIWVLLSAYLNGNGKGGLDVRLTTGAGCTTYITKAIQTDEGPVCPGGHGRAACTPPAGLRMRVFNPVRKAGEDTQRAGNQLPHGRFPLSHPHFYALRVTASARIC